MLMLDLYLFVLVVVLFVLQFAPQKTPRVIVSIAVVAMTVWVIGDYQIKLYISQSEQESISRMFQGSNSTDDFTWAINAANRYWGDRENYTEREPNYRSYFSYIDEERNRPDVIVD